MTPRGVLVTVGMLAWGAQVGLSAVIYHSQERRIRAAANATFGGAEPASDSESYEAVDFSPFVASASAAAATVPGPPLFGNTTGESTAEQNSVLGPLGFSVFGAGSAEHGASHMAAGGGSSTGTSYFEVEFSIDSPMLLSGSMLPRNNSFPFVEVFSNGEEIVEWFAVNNFSRTLDPGTYTVIARLTSLSAVGFGWTAGSYNVSLTPEPTSGLLLAVAGLIGLQRRR